MTRRTYLSRLALFLLAWFALVAFVEAQRRAPGLNAIFISPDTREIVLLPGLSDTYRICTAESPTGQRGACVSVAELRKGSR